MTLRARVLVAAARRRALGLPSQQTNAYRVVHGAGDGCAGFTVDVYGRFAVVSSYLDDAASEREMVDAVAQLDVAGVYLKRRPKQANLVDSAARRERAPEHAVRGEDAPFELAIVEEGMPWLVRLGDGMSTGLFLDQRDNRKAVRGLCSGQSVLNLFAYTCGFGAAAALGGARATTNVDVSKPALERGKRAYEHAGISLDTHRFLARDVLETLPKLSRRDERYDLIVLDPPSYARTKRGRFTIERSLQPVVIDALAALAPRGTLLVCVNQVTMTRSTFAGNLRAAIANAGRDADVRFCDPPADHPTPSDEPPHLKSAWVTLR